MINTLIRIMGTICKYLLVTHLPKLAKFTHCHIFSIMADLNLVRTDLKTRFIEKFIETCSTRGTLIYHI